MQLLFYVSLEVIYIDLTALYYIVLIITEIYNLEIGTISNLIHKIIPLISYAVVLVFSGIIVNFTKFHIELVCKNSTTIESLDKEHQDENAKYNVSLKVNWEQIFGENKLFWFLPFDGENSKPKGDGLSWEVKSAMRDSDGPKIMGDRTSASRANDIGGFNNSNVNNLNSNYNSSAPINLASTKNFAN